MGDKDLDIDHKNIGPNHCLFSVINTYFKICNADIPEEMLKGIRDILELHFNTVSAAAEINEYAFSCTVWKNFLRLTNPIIQAHPHPPIDLKEIYDLFLGNLLTATKFHIDINVVELTPLAWMHCLGWQDSNFTLKDYDDEDVNRIIKNLQNNFYDVSLMQNKSLYNQYKALEIRTLKLLDFFVDSHLQTEQQSQNQIAQLIDLSLQGIKYLLNDAMSADEKAELEQAIITKCQLPDTQRIYSPAVQAYTNQTKPLVAEDPKKTDLQDKKSGTGPS